MKQARFYITYYSSLWLLGVVYILWGGSLFLGLPVLSGGTEVAAIHLLCALLLVLHSSLQHEAVHGHILSSRRWNDLLARPALGLLYPYDRYVTTHQQHHLTEEKGHPDHDPESFYITQDEWQRLQGTSRFFQMIYHHGGGRLLLSGVWGAFVFLRREWGLFYAGEGQVRRHWLLHLLFVVPIIGLVMASPYVTVTSYILYSVIPSLALLSVRSYIEHRSSHYSAYDTVLIEAGWLWRLLFLNNNYHVIHHDLPHLRWYQIHETFTAQKQAWLARAGDYHFSGYGAVFRRFFFSVPAWLRPPVFITKARHKDVG